MAAHREKNVELVRRAFLDLVRMDARSKTKISKDLGEGDRFVDQVKNNKNLRDYHVDRMWGYLQSCRESWQSLFLLTKHGALFSPAEREVDLPPELLASWLDVRAPSKDFAVERWSGANGQYLSLRASGPDRLAIAKISIDRPDRSGLPARYVSSRPDLHQDNEGVGFLFNSGNHFYGFARVIGTGVSEMRFLILRPAARRERFDFVGVQLAPDPENGARAQPIYFYQLMNERTAEALHGVLGKPTVAAVRASSIGIANLEEILAMLAPGPNAAV